MGVVELQSWRPATALNERLSSRETVVGYSVGDLTAIRMGVLGDPWRLSLVQRAAVWNELQVAYLLDSLVWGYPIGSFLLCTVKHGGDVLVHRDGTRRAEEAPPGVFQLLDGQQRMNALAALFAGGEKSNGSYLLSLDMERDLKDLTRRRKSVKRSLRYIHLPEDEKPVKERWRWLDVTKLYEASRAAPFPALDAIPEVPAEQWLALASRIDPECAPTKLPRKCHKEAAERVTRLIRAWSEKTVPVVKLYLRHPTDVLQVFNRVNRTGTPVAGDDVFFAAVRTLWRHAEENISRVSEKGSPRMREDTPQLLPPMDALRLVTRIASLLLEDKDVVPLDIERLRSDKEGAEARENDLIRVMRWLTKDERFRSRVRTVAERAARRSELGHALHEIPKRLLDPVFAWAATHEKDELTAKDFAPAWAFLLGAAAFRYLSVFGPAFERIAMKTAVEAGSRGEPFPVESIIAQCRTRWPDMWRGQRKVIGLPTTDDTKRDWVNANSVLFMHVVQEIPFELPEDKKIDVEHLYPRARVDHMKWKGLNDDQIRKRHPGAADVFRVGNLFILDRSLNREARDEWPDQKLNEIYRDRLWHDLFLADDERKDLLCACDALKAERVRDGMASFAEYVSKRELSVYDRITAAFPASLRFAGDPE